MFESLGAYAEAAKWATFLAILTALIALGNSIVGGLIDYGYNKHALEVAAANQLKEDTYGVLLDDLSVTPEPEVITVKEFIEVTRYVETEVEKHVYVCDDLGPEFIRVRNNIQHKIFYGEESGGEPDNEETARLSITVPEPVRVSVTISEQQIRESPRRIGDERSAF